MGKSLTDVGGTRRLLDAVIIITAAFFAFQQYASTRAITFVMLGRHRRCTLAKAMHGDRVIHRPKRAGQNVSGILDCTRPRNSLIAVAAYTVGNNPVKIRSCQCLNNIVAQDHHRLKSRISAMRGFKTFHHDRHVLPESS